MLVSSVYGSCCYVGPSPPEKYDNQLLGHLTPKYIWLPLIWIITIALPLSPPVTTVAKDLFLLVIAF